MFKKTKMTLLALLGVGCCITAGAGVVSHDVHAATDTRNTTFQVVDGASVRLKPEYENFGIRFAATVGTPVEGATYNMLILPKVLVDYYDNDTQTNKADIVTYMKALADKKGGSLSIVEDCQVDSDGKICGSIVNILWNNINRDFVAVAYYEKDGEVVVADRANDGTRSVITVSENAIESGDYDSDLIQKGYLVEKIRMGEKQQKGYAQEDTYIFEDFRYASGTGKDNIKLSQIGIGIADDWSLPSIVENGSDNGLQFKQVNDAYGLLTLDFGTVSAGTYKFSFTMTENAIGTYINATKPENGTIVYRNWKLMGWNGTSYGDDHGFLYQNYYVGNNTFEYYFTQAAEGEVKFGIAGMSSSAEKVWEGQGQILLDDMCLESVESIPTATKTLNVFSSAKFDEVVSPFIPVSEYGIYTRSDMSLSVDKTAGTLTGTSSDYGLITLNLGTVTPGNYKLTLKGEMSEKFPAVLGGATLTLNEAGELNYANINNMYLGYNVTDCTPTADGTYELLINVTNTLNNYALYIANNQDKDPCSITINEISFEKVDLYTKGYTFDFEDKLTILLNNSTVPLTGTRVLTPTISAGSVDRVTIEQVADENGNHSLHLKDNAGWGQWVRFWVGYLEAGTYTVSLDLTQTAGSACSLLSYNATADGWVLHELSKLTPDGNRYTYTFTLNKAVVNGYIGFRSGDGTDKCEVTIDNITITKKP